MSDGTVSNVNSAAIAGEQMAEHSVLIHRAGKYLSFSLEQEIYGIELLKVQEIIGVMHITSVPKSPEYIKGVINLRGKIIPVVDLRLKFGMVEKAYDKKTCIIVVNTILKEQAMAVGVIVDTVLEVIDFSAEQLQPPPDYRTVVDSACIDALGKFGEDVVILVDINKALRDEADMLAGM